jgi:hypothetical protein
MILMGQTHLESNWKGGGGPENLDFWEPRDLFLLITNKVAVFM